jgi:putative oxidoreductase
MDIGLVIIRIVIGSLFVGHGTQKLFGWFGGYGVGATGGFFEQLGYRWGPRMAVLTGLAEAGGGTFLALGFLTPFAAAAVIGVMLNAAIAVHLPKGIWNEQGGFELPLVYATAALGLAFVGPGRWAIDRWIGWSLTGIPWGVLAIALGLAVGLAVLATRRPPVAAEEEAREEPEAA